jgi:polar amino acid transport system substrate-binding protein
MNKYHFKTYLISTFALSILLATSAWMSAATAATSATAMTSDAFTVAPKGILRVVYLSGNPAQGIVDPVTGRLQGVARDLAIKLSRQLAVPVELTGVGDIQSVINTVSDGRADIGFLANDPSRRGPVLFSQTYLNNPQSLIAGPDSTLISLDQADHADNPGIKIGAARGDSFTLFLKRTLKFSSLVELDNGDPVTVKKAFEQGKIDAFGASLQRLKAIQAISPGARVLPGALFNVPQAIIVSAQHSQALPVIDAFINQAREDGSLPMFIKHADNGTTMAP